jgi:hypothetical protein
LNVRLQLIAKIAKIARIAKIELRALANPHEAEVERSFNFGNLGNLGIFGNDWDQQES